HGCAGRAGRAGLDNGGTMNSTAAALAALLLSFAAVACAALAMDRHHEQVSGHGGTAWRRGSLRVSAGVLVLATMTGCLQAWGTAVAALVCLGMLSCGAILTTLTLSYAPRRLPLMAVAAALTGLILVSA
ncbi:DUF3325 domain-containing protein, partial [Bordetella avium]